jgi:hypothetical protein
MASRKQDDAPEKAPGKAPGNAIDGLLRRSLARTPRSQDCPAPDILAAYYDRSLDGEETARYELHFSSCAHCRAQLAAMVRAGEPEAAKKPTAGWGWIANRWWFLPAAATAALGLLISVTLVHRNSQPALTQQVALNAPPPVAATGPEATSDSATSTKEQLFDRARKETAPSAAPSGTPEQKKKDSRLVAPRTDNFAAKSLPPASLAKTRSAEETPAAADSLSQDAELDAAAPARTPAMRRAAPALSTPAPVAGGFNAQNQVPQQNMRQDQLQNQQQNEVATQTVNQAPGQREARQETQAGSVSGGAVAGVLQQPAPSDSTQVSETAPARTSVSRLAMKADKAAMQNAEERSAQKTIPSPDSRARWRISGAGFVEFSQDGGRTWHGQLLNVRAQLVAGAAPGGRVCWLAGRDGVIYLTTNGTKWKKTTPPASLDFVAISARDARSASVTASDRRVFTTEDGGKTWVAAP